MKIVFTLSLVFVMQFAWAQSDDTTQIIVLAPEGDFDTTSSFVSMPYFSDPSCGDFSIVQNRANCNLQKVLDFVYKFLKYPTGNDCLEKENPIASFVINSAGMIVNVEIVKSSCKEFDEEVIRLLRLVPYLASGRSNGIVVVIKYVVPIKFPK